LFIFVTIHSCFAHVIAVWQFYLRSYDPSPNWAIWFFFIFALLCILDTYISKVNT